MRRKPILILCIVNAIVAVAVLFIAIPKLHKEKAHIPATPLKQGPKPSDQALWERVMRSTSTGEAAHYLGQIDDINYKKKVVEKQLRLITYRKSRNNASIEQFHKDRVLISEWAQLAEGDASTELLILLFNNTALTLSLRETALIQCVQVCQRHYATSNDLATLEPATELIDRAYKEVNSLQGIALKAEWFLDQKVHAATEPSNQLRERIATTLLNHTGLESNQIACLELLQSPPFHSIIDNEALYALYANDSSDALKTAILHYFIAKKDPMAQTWLQQLQPKTPGLEQLQFRAIQLLDNLATQAPVHLEP